MSYLYKINPFTSKMDMVSAGGISAGSWSSETSKTIASGAVALDGPGRYNIDTEGAAASDTLKTITGLSDGDEVILTPTSSGRTVHLKTGGNLKLQTNFSMDHRDDTARLICDASGFVKESGGRSDNE